MTIIWCGSLVFLINQLRKSLFRTENIPFKYIDKIKRIGVYYMCLDDSMICIYQQTQIAWKIKRPDACPVVIFRISLEYVNITHLIKLNRKTAPSKRIISIGDSFSFRI